MSGSALVPKQVSEKAQTSKAAAEDVLDLALRLGGAMSKGGASAERTKVTIDTFLQKLGYSENVILVNITSLIISVKKEGKEWITRTATMDHGVHFGILIGATAFVRDINDTVSQETIEEMSHDLDEILVIPHYWMLLTAFFVAIACGCIGLMVGGDFLTLPIVFIAAFIGMMCRQLLAACGTNIYISWLLTAWLTTVSSLLLSIFVIPTVTPDRAAVSPTLMLVPGVPITNAVLDLVHKKSDTGIARAAFLGPMLLCQGAGILLAFQFINHVFESHARAVASHTRPWGKEEEAGIAVWNPWLLVLADCLLASPAALGFGFLFQVPCRLLPVVALVGWIGHGTKTLLMTMKWVGSLYMGLANLLGTALMVMVAFAAEKCSGVPAVVFYIPGLVMLMPGMFIMNAIMNWHWILENSSLIKIPGNQTEAFAGEVPFLIYYEFYTGLVFLLRALSIVAGICFGVAGPTMLFGLNEGTSSSDKSSGSLMVCEDDADDEEYESEVEETGELLT